MENKPNLSSKISRSKRALVRPILVRERWKDRWYGLVIFFSIVSYPSLPEAYFEYKADLAFENRNFLIHRDNYQPNDFETFKPELTLTYDDEAHLKLNLHERLKIDFLDRQRNRYLPQEAYAMFYGSHLEFSTGLEPIRWGVANSFNPTDVINRPDFEDYYYDPERLGEVTINLKGVIDKAGPASELTFWGAVFPFFQESPLPHSQARFSLDGNANGIPFRLLENQEVPNYLDSIGAAFKVSSTIGAVDFSLHYYRGPDHHPAFLFVIDDRGALRLQPFYYLIDMVGTNISGSLGDFTFYLESAFVFTSENNARPHDIAFEDNNAIPSNHLQFVPGLDYTFHRVEKGDLKLSAEYLGEDDRTTTYRDFRPFKNDLFFGGQYVFNNTRFTQIKMGVIKDLGNNEMFGKLEFSSKLYKELKLEMEGVWVIRDRQAQTPLSVFENNSSVMARLSSSFGERLR